MADEPTASIVCVSDAHDDNGGSREPPCVAGNGQELCTHEDALTQVAHCGPCRFGQSEIYSARPVTDSFEQARMHTVPTT